MSGGWTRADIDKSNGCQAADCPLGCTEIPAAGVYARAAARAAEMAADYRARGLHTHAARAERAGWQLGEVAAYGRQVPA